MENLYPAGPGNVPANLTQPNSRYKRQAWLAVASLALFVLLYFALAGWFGWTAFRLIRTGLDGGEGALLSFLTGGCAGFLGIFMLKALFFVQRGGAPDDVEIKPDNQPELFAFLNRLADEAGAPRPHRVFISPRVNAAVFYDLSVLNLLFPSRKNLEIGLSLVNVLTLSELKAVLAHEFGHFAQRSMAIGSWVYIAQQIAAQVISKRDALDKLLRALSRTDPRIAWVGWVLSLIVWSIRSLLDTVFRLVVLAQRALSRQMEFQADLVAVSLTGSDELVHALHKLQAADEAWSRTLSFANAEFQRGRAVQDLFQIQTRVIEKIGRILDDPAYGKVPAATAATADQHRVFSSSFAQPPQMWSTHPANSDRENNAKRQYLAAPHDARSAWVLFRAPEAVRQQLTGTLFNNPELQTPPLEESLQALEQRYALLQYNPAYRGAYLGRSLARYASQSTELYGADAHALDIHAGLAALYPVTLAQDLQQLRELEEEKAALEALRDKVFQATGGNLVFRGNAVSRRDLAPLITQVAAEADTVRQRILAHDRQCRTAHLAAASKLGNGWTDYLIGLINLLHYAEHTLADLRDAQGMLGNVVAIVTADGKVSGRELKRLLVTANELHGVLHGIHRQKDNVQLDPTLQKRLGTTSWTALLEDFKLPPASKDNINDWMQVIDGWVNSLAGSLYSLSSEALEQLLQTETTLARLLHDNTAAETAPTPSRVPAQYPVLLPGSERKRQKKLHWWDRFQLADGTPATMARLLVALGIVGAVLGFGSLTGIDTPVTVYNGLGTSILAQVGSQQVQVGPFAAAHLKVEFNDKSKVSARTAAGNLIEEFTPTLTGTGLHYVYNVAGASPLVQWTVTYGNASEEEPRYLGARRWLSDDADVFFSDPPKSISSKTGGAKRDVLSGVGERTPEEVLQLAGSAEEAAQIAQAHAQWDEDHFPHTGTWKQVALQGKGDTTH